MSHRFTTFVLSTATVAALMTGVAHASGPRDSTHAGDRYGYSFRVDSRDVYSDGARTGRFDTYSEGSREIAPATRDTNNDRSLSGMDLRGVSAEPSRTIDVYTDGAVA